MQILKDGTSSAIYGTRAANGVVIITTKQGRAGNVPHLLAGTEDILTALFERTYAALTPCAQRAFLTLSGWSSSVPRLALETVLVRSTGERGEVEAGVDMLLQYSMAESTRAEADGQEFVALPLVSRVFGKRKLAVSPIRTEILADIEILQMLGPGRPDDIHVGLARRVELFIANVAKRVDRGEPVEQYADIVEMICRAYHDGYLMVARWYAEQRTEDGYRRAREALYRFLEYSPTPRQAAEAWRLLEHVSSMTDDRLGQVNALVERAQLADVSFFELSAAANRLNGILRGPGELDREHKRSLANRLIPVLDRRKDEADADDFSRMAWLAINGGQDERARQYATAGIALDESNLHCRRIMERLAVGR